MEHPILVTYSRPWCQEDCISFNSSIEMTKDVNYCQISRVEM